MHVEEEKLILSEDLKIKLEKGFQVGLLRGNLLQNEEEIEKELAPVSVPVFFENLRKQVLDYYLEK